MKASRRRLKWALPDVVHPVGEICFQVKVPNNIYYVGAFLGAMFLLSKPYAWEDDPAHTALEVGKVWRKIFDELRPGGCLPPQPAFGHGIEEDFEMPLRVDCDCNVFVTCCDGTEKQLLTADQVRELLSNGGAGTPQPQPGGSCQTYHMTIPAGAVGQLIPTVVNSGDTIELSNLAGAWYGGSITWYCPDGSVFFVDCTGATNLNGGSQMPAVPIGRVIALINGTYYDILGSTFTVPGGIVNQQVTLLMNTDTVVTAAGSITLDAEVCNNQSVGWTEVEPLEFVTGLWTTDIPGVGGGQTVWTPGSGWASVDCYNLLGGSGRYNVVFLRIVLPHTGHFTHFDMDFDAVVGDLTDGGHQLVNLKQGATDNSIISTVPVSGTNQHLFWDGDLAGVTEIQVLIYGADHNDTTCPPSGSALLKHVNASGPGSSPFI